LQNCIAKEEKLLKLCITSSEKSDTRHDDVLVL
jgi:hypothetical protein